MATHPKKSLIPSTFYDQAKQNRRGFYWLTPVVVLFLYLCVMGVFLWLQRLQNDSVMFVTIDQETRQQRLMMVILALSLVIVVSLLALWRYTRFRTHAEAAQTAETGFRRAMENSMSTGMRVFDMQGRIAYVNPAFCRMIGWNEADLVGRTAPLPLLGARPPSRQHQHTMDLVAVRPNTPSSGLEVEAQRRDGSRFTARMYVSPLAWTRMEQADRLDDLHDGHHRAQAHPRGPDCGARALHDGAGRPGRRNLRDVADTSGRSWSCCSPTALTAAFFGAHANGHAELLGGRLRPLHR
jgi:PAS domain S-box-containing protein